LRRARPDRAAPCGACYRRVSDQVVAAYKLLKSSPYLCSVRSYTFHPGTLNAVSIGGVHSIAYGCGPAQAVPANDGSTSRSPPPQRSENVQCSGRTCDAGVHPNIKCRRGITVNRSCDRSLQMG
jgi:hypothetical protein